MRLGGWAAGRLGALCLVFLATSPLAAQPPGRPAAQPPGRAAAQDSLGSLRNPEIVQQRARTDSLDNAAIVQALEKRLKCTCGCNLDVYTCRTTDFTCTTSPAMHRDVVARLSADSAGLTQASVERVVAAFVAQYGESILMQPPRRGFNWTAYLMPFVALLLGLAIVGAFARRLVIRHASSAAEPAGQAPAAAGSVSDADRGRLRRELEAMES